MDKVCLYTCKTKVLLTRSQIRYPLNNSCTVWGLLCENNHLANDKLGDKGNAISSSADSWERVTQPWYM